MEKIDSRENLIRLINRYQNLVFSICLKMTGDYFTAEDITQDTFVSVFKNWEAFDGTNEKTWVCRIATNKCIDYKRAAARRIVFIDDETIDDVPDSTEILNEIINKDLVRELENAVNSLEEPYRSIGKKHFIEGKTAKEISIECGVGIKTVQTRIYRARSRLKKIIRKEDWMT